jgi:hypothetical protein
MSRPFVDGLQKFWLRWPVTVDKLQLTSEAVETKPSISAIARDWGTSRPYASRCINHRGCPRTSLQEAREWREFCASKRAPTARQCDQWGEDNSAENSTLIPFAVARDMAWRHYDEILDLVLALPKNIAAQCNPADPQLALTVLESECTSIHWAAYEMYTVWSKVGPASAGAE